MGIVKTFHVYHPVIEDVLLRRAILRCAASDQITMFLLGKQGWSGVQCSMKQRSALSKAPEESTCHVCHEVS